METPTRLSSRSSLPAQSVWDLSPTPETDALLDKLGKLNEQEKAQILEHLHDLQWLDKQNALTSSCASELRRILEQGGKY